MKIKILESAKEDLKEGFHYYYLMKAWKQSDNTSFNFYDAHGLNTILDNAGKQACPHDRG
jgi:hypothetical protein